MIDLRNPFVLREDLYAFDGALIVRQGEFITQGVLDGIKQNSPSLSIPKTPLKETGLFHDFSMVMEEENYQTIFNQQELRSGVLKRVGEIPLSPEILQELEFFKLKDYYTYRHILITTAMTVRMAEDLYQDQDSIMLAASTALTHDFGKSRIPLDVLQSTTKLTYEEYVYIHEHPWIGFLLLTFYTGDCESTHSLVSFNHHEKIDGSGYPRGVKVDDPITQFVTINDMFDALISYRPYREEPFNIRGALDFLCDEAELGKINMTGVKLLLSYNRHNKPPIDSIVFSQDHLGYRPPDELNNYSSPDDYEETDLDETSGPGYKPDSDYPF